MPSKKYSQGSKKVTSRSTIMRGRNYQSQHTRSHGLYYKLGLVFALLVFAATGSFLVFRSHASSITLHYTTNTGTSVSAAAADGYNVFDVAGSTSNPAGVATTVNSLPAGTQALVWVGNLDNAPVGSACPVPGFTTAQFQAQINALAGNAKVFGYYVSDEPHPSVCPSAVSDIAARADYIHAHTTQKAFIVVLDGSNLCGANLGCEYQALAPANTHVDLVGLDPYPCHYTSTGTAVPCDTSQITTKVNTAITKGIPVSAIVPTFQTFGQEGRSDGKTVFYRTPTTSEMTAMLNAWHAVVPNPVMDYSYTYGVQCSVSSCPAPQALANHPELASLLKAHNVAATPPPPGTVSGPIVGVASKCIDNAGNHMVDGNKIQLWACNSTKAQVWKVSSATGPIVNANGYCLDVAGAGTTNGTLVQLLHCTGGPGQQWTINTTSGTITNPSSGLCLDDKAGLTTNGTQIRIWTCNGTVAQKWKTAL
jgi:hypothetical protein